LLPADVVVYKAWEKQCVLVAHDLTRKSPNAYE